MPIQLPIGEEKTFRGVVDLVSKKAFVFKIDDSGQFAEEAIPADNDGRPWTPRAKRSSRWWPSPTKR